MSGATLSPCAFVGVTSCASGARPQRRHLDLAAVCPGCWGIKTKPFLLDRQTLIADGGRGGTYTSGPSNAVGDAFGAGERVGVLADMDSRPRTLRFFRDGTPLTGTVSGFPASVRILAEARPAADEQLQGFISVATLAFPPAPALSVA